MHSARRCHAVIRRLVRPNASTRPLLYDQGPRRSSPTHSHTPLSAVEAKQSNEDRGWTSTSSQQGQDEETEYRGSCWIVRSSLVGNFFGVSQRPRFSRKELCRVVRERVPQACAPSRMLGDGPRRPGPVRRAQEGKQFKFRCLQGPRCSGSWQF